MTGLQWKKNNSHVIGKVCDVSNTKHKTAGGFVWKYLNKPENIPKRKGKTLSEETKEKMSKASIEKSKKVIMMDSDGNYLKTYKNSDEAAKDMGVQKITIQNVCNGKRKTSCGFKWRYETRA
jgi:hypothetical protein